MVGRCGVTCATRRYTLAVAVATAIAAFWLNAAAAAPLSSRPTAEALLIEPTPASASTSAPAAAPAAASPPAASVSACAQEDGLAQLVADARDRGVPEGLVTMKARSLLPEPALQQAAATLVHAIYNDGSLRGLSPAKVGLAVGSVCRQGRASSAGAP